MTLKLKVLKTVWSGTTDNSERSYQIVVSLVLFPGVKEDNLHDKIMKHIQSVRHTHKHTLS